MVRPRDIPFEILRWGYDFVAERDERGLFVIRRVPSKCPYGDYLTGIVKLMPKHTTPCPIWGDLPAARRVREETLGVAVVDDQMRPETRDENGRVLTYRANTGWLQQHTN